MFYFLNAKPDTETRLLSGAKTIALEDIRDINERIIRKLNNHTHKQIKTAITLILSEKNIKDYSIWAEFNRENWNTINQSIESISIIWDILINLPECELPQRHTIRLKIGSAISPKEMFEIVFNSEDPSELLEARESGVCKIDFIDRVLATEFLNIVSTWYEGLKEAPQIGALEHFFASRARFCAEIIRISSPILLFIIYYLYSPIFLTFIKLNTDITIDTIQKLSILLFSVISLCIFVGRHLARIFFDKITNYKKLPNFSITKGDKNQFYKIQEENNKLSRKIFFVLSMSIASLVLSIFAKFIIFKLFGLSL